MTSKSCCKATSRKEPCRLLDETLYLRCTVVRRRALHAYAPCVRGWRVLRATSEFLGTCLLAPPCQLYVHTCRLFASQQVPKQCSLTAYQALLGHVQQGQGPQNTQYSQPPRAVIFVQCLEVFSAWRPQHPADLFALLCGRNPCPLPRKLFK